MIDSISKKVADLVAQNKGESPNVELAKYAVFTFLFELIPLAIVLAIGIPFGMVVEGLLMITPYMLLRKFCGGYHLKSSKVCTVTSVCVITLAFVMIHFLCKYAAIIPWTVVVFCSCVIIWFFSPIDSEARKLSKKETDVFRRITRVMLLIVLAIYVALLAFDHGIHAVSIGTGVGSRCGVANAVCNPADGGKGSSQKILNQ